MFCSTNPPRFDQRGRRRRRHAVRRPARRRLGHARRLADAPARAPRSPQTAIATIVTVESEFSFRYTKLLGEWTRDTLETSSGDAIASGWFVQGQQTLTPRWFVAGRVERHVRTGAHAARDARAHRRLHGVEETIGFHDHAGDDRPGELSRAPRCFGRPEFSHQAMASVVWGSAVVLMRQLKGAASSSA